MRMIDADALQEAVKQKGTASELIWCVAEIDRAPTIDAEPVRHGTWKLGVSEKPLCISACKCSECGRFIYPGVRLPEITRKYLSEIFPYCHCGAKMDGGVSDEG